MDSLELLTECQWSKGVLETDCWGQQGLSGTGDTCSLAPEPVYRGEKVDYGFYILAICSFIHLFTTFFPKFTEHLLCAWLTSLLA